MNDIANALKDIHLPDPISWWPPAMGWWLLIAACLLFMISAGIILGRYLRNSLKKEASKTLDAIEASFGKSADATTTLAEISVLLRRIAISRNSKNAGLIGEAWLKQLDPPNSHEFSQGAGKILTNGPYQPEVDAEGLLELFKLSRKVINRL